MVRRVSRRNYRSKRVRSRGSRSSRKRVKSRRTRSLRSRRSLRRRRMRGGVDPVRDKVIIIGGNVYLVRYTPPQNNLNLTLHIVVNLTKSLSGGNMQVAISNARRIGAPEFTRDDFNSINNFEEGTSIVLLTNNRKGDFNPPPAVPVVENEPDNND